MKRSVILILACAALLLSGCDFVRTLAGRPTSDDLEVKRSHIERAAPRWTRTCWIPCRRPRAPS